MSTGAGTGRATARTKVLVTGAGAAARNSIGLVLVGGMAIGTVFTLFLVPALYMLLAKEKSGKL